MQIGEKIRRLRVDQHVSASALGKGVGRTTTTILEIERGGTKDPKVSIIRGMAHVLGVSMDWLTDEAACWPPVAAAETPEERELLRLYRTFGGDRRAMLLGYAFMLRGGVPPNYEIQIATEALAVGPDVTNDILERVKPRGPHGTPSNEDLTAAPRGRVRSDAQADVTEAGNRAARAKGVRRARRPAQ